MRHGFTLVELLVVLALIGIVLGVSPFLGARSSASNRPSWNTALERARSEAATTGRAVAVQLDSLPCAQAPAAVLALPDGRVLGSCLDPLTGEPHASGY